MPKKGKTIKELTKGAHPTKKSAPSFTAPPQKAAKAKKPTQNLFPAHYEEMKDAAMVAATELTDLRDEGLEAEKLLDWHKRHYKPAGHKWLGRLMNELYDDEESNLEQFVEDTWQARLEREGRKWKSKNAADSDEGDE